MNVTYVCKAVDETSSTVANQVRWIRALAGNQRVGSVLVLAARRGPAELPPNVAVRTFGSNGWPRTILGFWRQAGRLRPGGTDFFFVAQGGPYPALLLPFKLVLRRPLYQWKAHPHVSARMRFYARWCDDLVFTATAGSFPMRLEKVKVVGHGIDTELFSYQGGDRSGDLVALGRIAPVKRIEVAIRALAECRDRFGLDVKLDVVGPCLQRDEEYRRGLIDLAERLGLADLVRFRGAVRHDEVPALLGRYRASINFSRTAFDKAAGETMATGTPVITSNPCTIEMLPPHLRFLAVREQDPGGQAQAIHEVLSCDEARRTEVGHALRELVVRDHSLDALFDKILDHIDSHRRPGPSIRAG